MVFGSTTVRHCWRCALHINLLGCEGEPLKLFTGRLARANLASPIGANVHPSVMFVKISFLVARCLRVNAVPLLAELTISVSQRVVQRSPESKTEGPSGDPEVGIEQKFCLVRRPGLEPGTCR
jgi:hypothetical protein